MNTGVKEGYQSGMRAQGNKGEWGNWEGDLSQGNAGTREKMYHREVREQGRRYIKGE
jgi:hypothetical protein